MNEFRQTVEQEGFAILPSALPTEAVDALAAATEHLLKNRPRDLYGGVRDLFNLLPAVKRLACSSTPRKWVEAILGPGCFAVRGLLFEKDSSSNWKVPYHQDLTIAVQRRTSAPHFGPWSVKAGVPHVQPPVEVLEKMLAVRIHLDDCGPENGPLRVLPGSHRFGVLSAAEVENWRHKVPEVSCHVLRGGLLVMRPLLLHASSPALQVGHRRVIHLEYAAAPLLEALEWHEALS
jgi:hypothetical protein